MSTESGNHDKLARYIGHARQLGIDVLAPDVNESSRAFTGVAGGIRFGLAGVKNVGEGAIDCILEARRSSEPQAGAQRSGGERAPRNFESIFDFACRVDGRKVNRRVVESLVKCGAFDSLHENRAALWATLDTALEAGAAALRDREIGQTSLFDRLDGAAGRKPTLVNAADWTDRQRLAFEKEVLGFYVTGHPLTSVAPELARFVDVSAEEATRGPAREVRAGGLLTSLRETRTRRGARMAFGTLDDLEGSFDLVVFSEPYLQYESLLKQSLAESLESGPVPLLVSGTLEPGDTPKILVREVIALDRAEEQLSTEFRIRLQVEEASRDRLMAMRAILERQSGDCAVVLHLVIAGESETVLSLSSVAGVRPNRALCHEVDALFGRGVAEIVA